MSLGAFSSQSASRVFLTPEPNVARPNSPGEQASILERRPGAYVFWVGVLGMEAEVG
jgi:hypothetical protein